MKILGKIPVLLISLLAASLSCQKENRQSPKPENENTFLERIDYSGWENNSKVFELKAPRAIINKKADIIDLKNPVLYLFENNRQQYIARAEKGIYKREENLVLLQKIMMTDKKGLSLNAETMNYSTLKKETSGNSILLDFHANRLEGKTLSSSGNFTVFRLTKVKAKLNY